MRYKRLHVPGTMVFLTLVTANRQPILCKPDVRSVLSHAVQHVRGRHEFRMVAYVVLPDHCHMLWQLPDQDGDFSTRVRLIKHFIARHGEMPSPVWQKRFWDHLIRDEDDLKRHCDYIHYNPVKHGYVQAVREWPDSSFHRFVERGEYGLDWGSATDLQVAGE